MTTQIPIEQIALIAIIAAVVGEGVMSICAWFLWKRFYVVGGNTAIELFGPEGGLRETAREFTRIKGAIERIRYASAPLLGVPEGIAVVLALNGIAGLKMWSDVHGEKAAMGRAAFNIWLSLNLLNVIVGIGIALFVKQLLNPAQL